MTEISYSLNVQVVGGPQLSASRTINVDAYDVVSEELTDQEVERIVEIQPATDPKRVQFLLINSDEYGDQLTYKVNDAPKVIKLDGPQVFVGEGLVELLDPQNPQATPPVLPKAPAKLNFTNKLGKTANVEVVVGRKTS